jgi:hypothetical protein
MILIVCQLLRVIVMRARYCKYLSVTGIASVCVGARNPGNDAGEKVPNERFRMRQFCLFLLLRGGGLLGGSGCLALGAGWRFRLVI